MTNTEVNFEAFEADVERVVEAAAERDAAVSKIGDEFVAYSLKLNEREDALRRELAELENKRHAADRIRQQRTAAAYEAFRVATDLDESPVF